MPKGKKISENAEFNKIAFKAATIYKKSNILDDEGSAALPTNKILQEKQNVEMLKIVSEIKKTADGLVSNDFIINNIERFSNRTLKNFLTDPKKNKKEIEIVRPTKKRAKSMDDYDKAIIVKMIKKGVAINRILEVFTCYSSNQIRKIIKEYNLNKPLFKTKKSSLEKTLKQVEKFIRYNPTKAGGTDEIQRNESDRKTENQNTA